MLHEAWRLEHKMEEDFDQAENAMSAHESEHSAPVLSDAERQAMRRFCLESLEMQKTASVLAKERKQIADIVKDRRAKLQEWIRQQDDRCFMMPKDVWRDMESQLGSKGLQSLPPFLRLQKNTSDAAITPVVAESAIMDLTFEDVQECAKQKQDVHSALKEAIVNAARLSVRSTKEAVALSQSVEKGLKPMQVQEVPQEVAQMMFEMHESQEKLKKQSSSKRETTQQVSDNLKKLEPVVLSVLNKTGRNAQQVQLDGVEGKHRIVKRVSARGGKVTLTVFEKTVANTLSLSQIPSDSLESAWHSFQKRKKELVKQIQLQLTSLPKKEVTSIKLVSASQPKKKKKSDAEGMTMDDDEQEEDEDEQEEADADEEQAEESD